MNVNQLNELEKLYMTKIWKILSSESFHRDLRSIEMYIQNKYNHLKDLWGIKNKIKIAAERLIRFYGYTKLRVVGVYPSPMSSDMAIYTNDTLLNIDAKTIDMIGNKGDDLSIHFQSHQITFNNNTFFDRKIMGYQFGGVNLDPGIPEFENGKPTLTFFISINYCDNQESFCLSHLSLCCVPHGIIVKEEYKNNIISNFKTYDYLKKERALSLKKNNYLPRKQIKDEWINFPLKGGGQNDAYIDPSLKHPFINNSQCVWKKIDSKYMVLLGGLTARIPKEKLKDRKAESGNWEGFKRINIKGYKIN